MLKKNTRQIPYIFFELSSAGGNQSSLVNFFCFLANTKLNIRKRKCFVNMVFTQRCEIALPASLWKSLSVLIPICCLLCLVRQMLLIYWLHFSNFSYYEFEFWSQRQVSWDWWVVLHCLGKVSDAKQTVCLLRTQPCIVLLFHWILWGLERQKHSNSEEFRGSIYSELRMLPVLLYSV